MKPSKHSEVTEPSDHVSPAELAALAGCRDQLADRLEAVADRVISSWWQSSFDPERIARYRIDGTERLDRELAQKQFLAPLFALLVAHLRTGDEVFRDVYLDERLRYAPHRASPEARAAFFSELLSLEEAALHEALGGSYEAELSGHLRNLHAPLVAPPSSDSIALLGLGDCLLNEVRVFLPPRCRTQGAEIDMRCLYFSAAMSRDLPTEQIVAYLSANPTDLIAASFLSYEGIPLYPAFLRDTNKLRGAALDDRITALVGLMRRLLETLREHTDAPFLLHNASGLPLSGLRRRIPLLPPIGRSQRRALAALNAAIAEVASHTPNCILIDEAALAQTHGYRHCNAPVIPADIADAGQFHTARFGSLLADTYANVVKAFRMLRKTKVLLIDFDNTLWEGVMADGPVNHHHQAQGLLKRLQESGILLVAVSKNDEANIRWDEMTLKPDDFVLQKINWNLKAASIAESAASLNLGLDSFVLIDDSPEERGLVAGQLPSVTTLDPNDPATWQALEWMLDFPNTRDTDEARARTEMYRAQAKRAEASGDALDYPAMMASLELCARFRTAESDDLPRVAELVQRTNQFNTTTIRHSIADLDEFAKNPEYGVYVAEVSDRYGDLGLVCVVIAKRTPETCILDSFVMSCRAMGFGLELWMLHRVLEAEGRDRAIEGRFLQSDRNAPASTLYPEAGFSPGEESHWRLDPSAPGPEAPTWFKSLPQA